MGFIPTSFNVKKLARNLDRKSALPDKNPEAAIRGACDNTVVSGLDDYIRENIFMPILSDSVIPIGRLDFDRITEDDVDAVYVALENTNLELLRFCATMESFPASPSGKQIII